MKNAICVKFNGGLGNQMFQWAFARAISQKVGCDFVFDMSFFEKKYARPFELSVFGLSAPSVSDFWTKLKLGLIWKFRKKLSGKNFCGIDFYAEPHFEYDAKLMTLRPNTYIEGFFQSEKYFESVADLIRADFKFSSQPDSQNAELLSEIANCESVSLHIRRGDYVQKKRYQNLYATCSLDYYRRAVEAISQQKQIQKLFIFSDDIQWVKENLELPYQSVYVSNNFGSKSFEDMRLMSACKHNVIANSSFSWWGAWLNGNPDKIVVSPKKWFNDDEIIQSDVIPDSWIRLDN